MAGSTTRPIKESAKTSSLVQLAGERFGRGLLAIALPLAVLILWQLSGKNGAVAGGALPTPDGCGTRGSSGPSASPAP